MKIIGIVGTAKNTGKTTTLSRVIRYLAETNSSFVVTGIGYDGEEIDNITNLPKPRLFFGKGSVVATSERCLTNIDAEFEVLYKTEISTPLGKVHIIKIQKPGMVVLAGPNQLSDLKKLSAILSGMSFNTLLVDGSLNRMAPLSYSDELIFTTGASRNTNIDILADEMYFIEKCFSLPLMNLDNPDYTSIPSLIDEEDVQSILSSEKPHINITGLVNSEAVKKLITTGFKGRDLKIIFSSPVQLILTFSQKQIYEQLQRTEEIFFIKHRPDIKFITVNPFYPLPDVNIYKPSYINKDILLRTIRNRITVPVYNVFEHEIKI